MSVLYYLKPSDLISPQYVELQKELHARPKGYGGKGDKWAPAVSEIALQYGATSVLDYGCGQGSLKKALQQIAPHIHRIDEFDPAIPGKHTWPEFADLVVCTDVLEHVEPGKLGSTLGVIRAMARKAVFMVIATRPSNKTMADGRNAHLIVESEDWWRSTLERHGFRIHPGPASPLKKPSREFVAVLTC